MTNKPIPASLRTVDAVLWDFDGVIADTEPCQARAYEIVLARNGVVLPPGWFDGFVGRTERTIWSELVHRIDPATALPDIDALMQERVAVYLAEAAGLTPSWFLDPVLALDIAHHIVSAGNHDAIATLLDRWGLTERFVTIRASDSPATPAGQPKDERLHATLVELAPAACAVIEDGAGYLELARTLGAVTVGVQHALNDAHHDVDIVVDHRQPYIWMNGGSP